MTNFPVLPSLNEMKLAEMDAQMVYEEYCEMDGSMDIHDVDYYDGKHYDAMFDYYHEMGLHPFMEYPGSYSYSYLENRRTVEDGRTLLEG